MRRQKKKNKKKQPILLKYDNVTFSAIDKQGNKRDILNGLSGHVRKGELVAIMGSSGAGKTTLFNIISGRQANNKVVTVGGTLNVEQQEHQLGPKPIIYDVAYVMQFDQLPATLSVWEMFRFSAKLRLPALFDENKIAERATEMCHKMGLVECKDSLIGDAKLKGISGGQKKRVGVGVELIADPNFVFLDEPTTGLDSHSALKLVQVLRKLADEGHCVVVVIHQPSADVIQTFDTLWLLCNGKFVYNGPVDEIGDYFASIEYPNEEGQNIADHIIDCIYFDGLQPKESLDRQNMFIDTWTEHAKKLEAGLEFGALEVRKSMVNSRRSAIGNLRIGERPGQFTQYRELMGRELIDLKRSPDGFKVKVGQLIFSSLLAGLVFLDLEDNYPQGLTDRSGACFFCCLNAGMLATSSCILTFPTQKTVFERERKNRMYWTMPYVAAKNTIMMIDLLFPFVSVLILKYMMGLDIEYIELVVSLMMCTYVSQGLGFILGAAAPDEQTASQLMPAMVIPFILMCGFLVNLDNVEDWLSWIQYIDVYKYVLESILIGEMDGNWYDCEQNSCPSVMQAPDSVRCMPGTSGADCPLQYSGTKYIEEVRAVDTSMMYNNWLICIALALATRFIFSGILVHKNGW